MSRNLDNLKRLFQKFQARYGTDDPIVLQMKQELEARQMMESPHPVGFAPCRERRLSKGPDRHRNAASANLFPQ
jgi:hypothetical protein